MRAPSINTDTVRRLAAARGITDPTTLSDKALVPLSTVLLCYTPGIDRANVSKRFLETLATYFEIDSNKLRWKPPSLAHREEQSRRNAAVRNGRARDAYGGAE